ncbi:MAG TPA: cytochrome P450 [Polyangiaceae bacterium]|nr:cytochrome P450 [Polyangiaceae bacterium]
MEQKSILRRIFDPANRANPYPLFTELRRTPVCWQEDGPHEDGTWVVSTYREIVSLLHDPRVSSDLRNCEQTGGDGMAVEPYTFIRLDPPEHDRLRRLTTRHFGPPERPGFVEQLRPQMERIATSLVDGLVGERPIDVVARVAYPLPVQVICAILGVPLEDQPRFRAWADALVAEAGRQTTEARTRRNEIMIALRDYMLELVERRRREPGDDLLSRMATDTGPDGRMADAHLAATASLLLIAGHETTVNLIANGVLTLLRNPGVFERLRREPALVVGAVEELLRYEPPVQLLSNRTTLQPIEIGDTTIPRGVILTLALAAGNRDPTRFVDPDRFDPERRDNAHLGFGSGIHYCFGAPLARIEAQIALRELARRLERPRLVVDPPPYRSSPMLRGPRELLVEVDEVRRPDAPPAPFEGRARS